VGLFLDLLNGMYSFDWFSLKPVRFNPSQIEASCSKPPTRQSRYGDGALRKMRSQAGSNPSTNQTGFHNVKC
jgi:hypothetical protein